MRAAIGIHEYDVNKRIGNSLTGYGYVYRIYILDMYVYIVPRLFFYLPSSAKYPQRWKIQSIHGEPIFFHLLSLVESFKDACRNRFFDTRTGMTIKLTANEK